MNIENLPKLAPIEIGYIIDPALPVIPLALDVKRSGCAAPHAHPRGQLIYASSGVMRVVCGRDIWVVPPAQAVWVPPNIEHEVYFPGDVSLRNLFIDSSVTESLPRECTVLKVTPLLRELILASVAAGKVYGRDSAEYRLNMVIIDQLLAMEPSALRLPMGRDERLTRAMTILIRNPGDRRGIHELAREAGASTRTLARLFVSETGLTCSTWRKRLVLQEAITRLGNGCSVTEVACDLGYQSMSAFIGMFRQELGAPPSHYMRPAGG